MTITTSTSTSIEFDRRINFWGRITLGLGLLISLGAPIYLFTVDGLWPGWDVVIAAFLGIATIFVVNWIVEPVTYFPMLGMAGTYQAWLVGNISNKLLPASITAQAAIGVKPGTRKAELVAIAAISGAVIVHIVSLTLLVAIGGTLILSILPEPVTAAFAYILPAIMGPVFVQLAMTVRNVRTIGVALGLAIAMVFVVIPNVSAVAMFALPVTVVLTVTAAILMARRKEAASRSNQKPTNESMP